MGVDGRIDHMAVDLVHNRLFIAALGNDTVEIVAFGHERIFEANKGAHHTCNIESTSSR